MLVHLHDKIVLFVASCTTVISSGYGMCLTTSYAGLLAKTQISPSVQHTKYMSYSGWSVAIRHGFLIIGDTLHSVLSVAAIQYAERATCNKR